MFTEGLFLIEEQHLAYLNAIGWDKYIRLFEHKDNLKKTLQRHDGLVFVSYMGSLYNLDFKSLWEQHFRDLSFAGFKHCFYSNSLPNIDIESIFKPKMLIDIEVKNNLTFSIVHRELSNTMSYFEKVLDYFRVSGSHFTIETFCEQMRTMFPGLNKKNNQLKMIVSAVLNTLNEVIVTAKPFSLNSHFLDFNINTNKYTVTNTMYKQRISIVIKNSRLNFGNLDEKKKRYVVEGQQNKIKADPVVVLAQLCELFGLISYEVKAGDNAQFFIRVNSESSLRQIADNLVNSKMIEIIHNRHENSKKWMTYFFTKLVSDDDRWNFIESYFLGKDFEEAATD